MGKKLSAFAMLLIAAALIFLVPVGLDAIETDNSPEPSVSQTTTVTTAASEETPVVTTAPETSITTTAATVTKAPETETKPVSSETKKETVKETQKTTPKETVKTTAKTTAKTTVKTTKKTTVTTTKKTTTTTKAQVTPTPSGKTPVAQHGQLSVKGANIVDQSGKVFQLRGMSTHGIGWFPDSVSKQTFKVLRDDWGCNSIRLAMYIEESWGGSESCYLADKDRNYKLVKNGIDYCIDLGMYVIVDWHILNPGDPTTHTEDAKQFFAKIASEYKDCPNIIYELCNEPNGGVNWSGKIKPYCEAVTKEIRKYDKDAIIVCGTGTWSQDIQDVVGNTLSDKNVVYALHFYANTHTDWLRDRLQSCYNSGLPVLVTEFGTCDASGNGGFNTSETNKWFDLMDKLNVGYYNWSISNKSETASAFTPSTSLANIKSGTSQLTESGKLVREHMRKRAGL